MAEKLSPFTIAATYVGTVVGAGFASGQEVLQFFSAFGRWGFVGIALATGLFVFFGLAIMELGHALKAESHLPVIQAAGGRWAGAIMDLIITFFLFGALVTMAAGSGAIFVEEFRLPGPVGSMLLLGLTLVTVLLGIFRVIESISFVAPVLLTSVLSLSLITILAQPQGLVANLAWVDPAKAAVPSWPLAALLYASYNLILSVAVLAPLGALGSLAALRRGAIWGGLSLGVGVLAIAAAILTVAPQVAGLEVPMIAVAGLISPYLRIFYSLVLVAEVYTTAVAGLYGFTSRLTKPDSRAYRALAILASIAAFILARFGFSTIVSTLYPAAGFAGLLLIGALTYGYLKVLLTRASLSAPAAKPEKKPDIEPATGSVYEDSSQDGNNRRE
ncbi:MAG: hypothetical protein PWQ86_35 [Bacillota bacterium]|nr:hypothetical protein [Bacillota bacterium]MDK2854822.1 hypothetical protein [Bacillota bacterium]